MQSPTEDQFPDELQVTNFEVASSILYPSLQVIVASLPKFVPSCDTNEPSVTLRSPQLITERETEQYTVLKMSLSIIQIDMIDEAILEEMSNLCNKHRRWWLLIK